MPTKSKFRRSRRRSKSRRSRRRSKSRRSHRRSKSRIKRASRSRSRRRQTKPNIWKLTEFMKDQDGARKEINAKKNLIQKMALDRISSKGDGKLIRRMKKLKKKMKNYVCNKIKPNFPECVELPYKSNTPMKRRCIKKNRIKRKIWEKIGCPKVDEFHEYAVIDETRMHDIDDPRRKRGAIRASGFGEKGKTHIGLGRMLKFHQ